MRKTNLTAVGLPQILFVYEYYLIQIYFSEFLDFYIHYLKYQHNILLLYGSLTLMPIFDRRP